MFKFASVMLFGSIASIVAAAWMTSAQAQQDGSNYAIVTGGAHLLAPEPNEQLRYDHIAYLPVGTVVDVSNDKEEITVGVLKEWFTKVTSQSGAHGYLHDDLYENIGDKELAVPVKPFKLPLFAKPYPVKKIRDILKTHPEYDCEGTDKCILFSRSDGVYLNVIGEKVVGENDKYYQVELVRPLDGSDPKTWYLYGGFVENQFVKLVDRHIAASSMMPWTAEKEFQTTLTPEFIGDTIDWAKSKGIIGLSKEEIWCDLEIKADGEMSVKAIFVSGGLSAGLTTKHSGEFQQVGTFALEKGGQRVEYDLNREIVCDESEPRRLNKMEISSAENQPPYKLNMVKFRDNSCHSDERKVDSCRNWILLKDSADDFGNIVVVGDWNTYYAVRGIIEEALGPIAGDNLDSSSDHRAVTLQRIEKENLYDFILRQIAVFKPVEIED